MKSDGHTSSTAALADELPQGWTPRPLGELCDLVSEQIVPSAQERVNYVGLEHIDSGNPQLRRWGESTDVTSSKNVFRPRDVLYGKLRPYLDKAVLAQFAGICSTDVLVFRARPDVVLPEFLIHVFHSRSLQKHAIENTSGVNLPRTSWSALRTLVVHVPPLDEQKAIADALQAAHVSGEASCSTVEAVRQLRLSLIQHLFRFGPVSVERSGAVERGETDAGEIPADWEVVDLGDEMEFIQYGTSERCAASSGHWPVLRIPNVIGGAVDATDLKHLDAGRSEIANYRLADGDVLFVRTNGQQRYVGRCAVYRNVPERALFASYLIRVRLKASLLPDFVQYYAESDVGRSFLSGRASGAADGKFNINTQTIRGVRIPRPSLQVQGQIVAMIKAVEAKAVAETARLSAVRACFMSMLEGLLRGTIRVGSYGG